MDQPSHTVQGKDVFCDEEVCLVREVYELPYLVPNVTVDIKLLKFTGIKITENELDLGLWKRVVWFDPRLKLCN